MSDNVRQEFKDIAARGNVTWEEYQEIRCNSYEQEILYPAMTNDCLIRLLKQVIIPNTSHRLNRRPAVTYDESLVANFIPILMERLVGCDNEIQKLKQDIDCGCGISGCQNMRRMCCKCKAESLQRELAKEKP